MDGIHWTPWKIASHAAIYISLSWNAVYIDTLSASREPRNCDQLITTEIGSGIPNSRTFSSLESEMFTSSLHKSNFLP